MGVDYVDIFYSHRPDPHTPLEETIGALDTIVRQGKALYAGISSYSGAMSREACDVAEAKGFPITIHQPRYNLLGRDIESDLLPVARERGFGIIAFCPLAQGLLTGKYLDGIPPDSRAALWWGEEQRERTIERAIGRVRALNAIAGRRGQSLAQMALAWILRLPEITSALIGASRVEQIEENVAALAHMDFSDEELREIDKATGPE